LISVGHSGMVRLAPDLRCGNCTSGNPWIPGSMLSLSSGRALRGPVWHRRGMTAQRAERVQVSPPQSMPTQPSTLNASGPDTEMLLA